MLFENLSRNLSSWHFVRSNKEIGYLTWSWSYRNLSWFRDRILILKEICLDLEIEFLDFWDLPIRRLDFCWLGDLISILIIRDLSSIWRSNFNRSEDLIFILIFQGLSIWRLNFHQSGDLISILAPWGLPIWKSNFHWSGDLISILTLRGLPI